MAGETDLKTLDGRAPKLPGISRGYRFAAIATALSCHDHISRPAADAEPGMGALSHA